ncbi:hypothetical protein Dsin_001311 [Dipteronia sinensis]|uniref:GST N-terminal domain-containing protein n=1 Tax=Dipteronia sinensis TaxID=43782 RepID=A0AAE0B521_9ROSI|nr:hypothetical protein Dsin_001311 [Dipteronia sinensis]
MAEAEQEVKLLVKWCSSFGMRVEWALKLKGIKFQVVEQDTTNKSPLLLNSNPIYKKIPFTEVIRKVIFTKGEQQEKEVKEAKEAMEVLEGELKGKKFFGGDNIGLVDIVLGWI